MTAPHLETYLPELMRFTKQLANDHQKGSLTNWDAFKQNVQVFYTSGMMTKIDAVVPGWIHMSSYLDQQTLIHVTSVLVALFLLPEYQAASAYHKYLMEWTVIFHDVAKKARKGEHDYTHGFRSAAVTGAALALIGFPARSDFAAHISDWKTLTENASAFDAIHNEQIQDNTKLPDIIAGIDNLYGQHSDAAIIIKAVLFHMSINNDPGYPTLSPLTSPEIQRYIDAGLFPILKAMMLVDSDGWNLFDQKEAQRLRQQTLDVFDDIASMNGIIQSA
ncbi:MAG: hypothetical protein GC179_04650 [Anaerolineaceae bacterium]|nr:hypothetical protein [Anaerolineaceae bacterium]